MALPTAITLEIAFATNPLATPTYTDVSSSLIRAELRRGRQHELGRTEAATLVVVLDNNDRAFEPEYAASPHYPHVVPMRRIRLSVTHDGNTYRLFTGFVERWPPSWELPNYSEITVTAVDGFALLAQADIDGTFPEELAGARVARILDEANWPAGDRSIDAGQSPMPEVTFEVDAGQKALAHLQEVSDSELGIPFVDGQGRLVFHDRHRRLKAPYRAPVATFSNAADGSGLTYERLIASFDVDELANDWRITREGGTAQTADDATSIDSYGRRTQTRTVLLTSDTEALDQARYLTSLFKDPHVRFERIEIEPLEEDALWAQVLGRELGDRIAVEHYPPGGGAALAKDVHIDGTTLLLEARPVVVGEASWQLTPTDRNSYLTLDDATYGRLDENKLAY